MIDTHAHLNIETFNTDIDDVISRAKAQGVSRIIVIGMDLETSRRAIELAHAYDIVYASVGLHPGYVDEETTDDITFLLQEEKVVAIGECGIDLYWSQKNLARQTKAFNDQIKLASQTKLPLIIHTRNSFLEAYQCVLPYRGSVRGVFHCFSSTVEDAKKAVDLGFYIGIDGPITYKNNQNIVELVEAIDLKHILIETDSPYLTPVPHRGQRNEPAHVYYVAKKIAEIKNMSLEEVIRITSQNAFDLFQLGGKIK